MVCPFFYWLRKSLIWGHGSAVPDLLLTNAISALSTNPSTFTSSRKFVPVTAWPDCDFVWEISAESTKRSALVSPARKLTGKVASPAGDEPSVTPFNVTEQRAGFGTPVKLIVT